MVSNPEIGNIYWCTLPDIESQSYGDNNARSPWRGKYYTKTNPHTGSIVGYISCFGSDGIDVDSNATAFVESSSVLFDDERSACAYFVKQLNEEIDAIGRKMDSLTKLRNQFIDLFALY